MGWHYTKMGIPRESKSLEAILEPTVCPLAPSGCEEIHILISQYFLRVGTDPL